MKFNNTYNSYEKWKLDLKYVLYPVFSNFWIYSINLRIIISNEMSVLSVLIIIENITDFIDIKIDG